MKTLKKLLLIATTLLFSFSLSVAATDNFTPAQKKQIQSLVRDTMVSNPEILIEASHALQRKQMQKAQKNAQKAIKENAKALFNDPDNAVMGNPNGNVTLVEFLDYQCGHCKEMANVVKNLIKKNSNLRVVIKELPVFGGSSEFAAKAALASRQQGKTTFEKFHLALFKNNGLTEDKVLAIAKTSGVNTSQLKKAMVNQKWAAHIKRNEKLAEALGLAGTPAFIIADRTGKKIAFIPGATSEAVLQRLIDQVRK